MKPGSTVARPASTTLVLRDARFRTSAFVPTATNFPAFTANASARGSAASCVSTRALTTMKSTASYGSGTLATSRSAKGSFFTLATPASIALSPRNSPRVYLRIRYTACRPRREPCLAQSQLPLRGACEWGDSDARLNPSRHDDVHCTRRRGGRWTHDEAERVPDL